LRTHPETVRFDWGNFGPKAARRGEATLYILNNENSHQEKIGTAQIVGAGTNVLPTSSGRAEFKFDQSEFVTAIVINKNSPTPRSGKSTWASGHWGAAGHPGAEDSQAWPCYFFAS
jgi:hypothetical protein